MTNFSATHWVNLSMATATGTTRLTWSAVHDISQTGTVTDTAPLGELNASDMFRNTSFTGFHVTVDGKAYGVFRSGHTYAVPYNKGIHDIWGAPVFASGETTQYLMPLSGAANCFLDGTRLATPGGPRGIETLAPGDLVQQTSGPPVPVIWIWRQTVLNLPQTPPLIRLRAHSLGPGTPARDLVVTPDHAIGIGGFLVTAQALMNGLTIHEVAHRDLPEHYSLWHVEVAAHCLLLAENCPAESFLAYGDRDRFDGHDAYLRHHGHDRPIPEMPLPRILCARHLPPALKARLGLVRVA
ncbi:Hint domain-containing protein [Roseicyclus marinus]|uniref:Hint domain-containing protein n=1 Tax=Roseicyclus marinus TaxID=2161673 RepID=UPI0024108E40|nr:Hint domain-containing protein [Roseicyclus marinus]MDG3040927.1 Hint domain-containing protein [Roseicyclus marinus]